MQFNYILAGRNSMKGIIKELGAERIVNSAIKVPIQNSLVFEEILTANHIKYNKKVILEAI